MYYGGRDTRREYAVEEREKRRAFQTETAAALAETGMAATERRQTGQTRRATMRIEADRLAAERKADVDRQAALAKVGTEGTKAKGGITADQMAKHRTGALKQSQERLEALRNPITNKIKHPATGEDMTSAQEAEYVKFEADNLLKYSLGGGETVAGEKVAPEGRGWLETEGGRRFEMGGERGFTETTPERAQMAPSGTEPPAGTMPPSTGEVAPPGVPPQQAVVAGVPAVVGQKAPGEAAATLRRGYEAEQQTAMPRPFQAMKRGVSKYLRENILSRPSYTPEQRSRMERTRMTQTLGGRGF